MKLETVQWKGFLAYLLALPVMLVKGVPVVSSKIQLSDVVFVLPLVAWGSTLRSRSCRFIGTPLLGPLSILVGVAILSSCASGLTGRSGLYAIGFVYTALLYLLIVNTVRTWAQWLRLITIWVVVSTVVASLGIFGVVLGWKGD